MIPFTFGKPLETFVTVGTNVVLTPAASSKKCNFRYHPDDSWDSHAENRNIKKLKNLRYV
jgi:hypothetical protein